MGVAWRAERRSLRICGDSPLRVPGQCASAVQIQAADPQLFVLRRSGDGDLSLLSGCPRQPRVTWHRSQTLVGRAGVAVRDYARGEERR